MTLEHPSPWAVSCESAGQPRILSAVYVWLGDNLGALT